MSRPDRPDLTRMTLSQAISFISVLLVVAGGTTTGPAVNDRSAATPHAPDHILVEDFEDYSAGGLPTRWQFLRGSDLIDVVPEINTEREDFRVESEDGNKFVRATVTDQAHRIVLPNEERFDWDLREHPLLHWNWRAVQVPPGAREDDNALNDTGAALYVYFGRDWLGRPRGIKYTYSSTLPVGTRVKYGPLRVLVVSTAADTTNKWIEIERDVAADYRALFNRDPPNHPDVIALWSDSDNTGATAIADFDNIVIAERN